MEVLLASPRRLTAMAVSGHGYRHRLGNFLCFRSPPQNTALVCVHMSEDLAVTQRGFYEVTKLPALTAINIPLRERKYLPRCL